MTREEAKALLPIIQAYAEGKTIQTKIKTDSAGLTEKWIDVINPDLDGNLSCYRIKPEPTYRPFKDAEECWQEMQKHQPFGWAKDKNTGIYKLMTLIGNGEYDYVVGIECGFCLERIFEYYTFADGHPFGVKEEEQ